MWVFHHIPKTAGSSVVRAWRQCVRKERFENVFVSDEDMRETGDYDLVLDRKFRQFQERVARDEVFFACGHFTHQHIDALIASGAKVFAFLRHPIDRLVSDYKYQLNPPSYAPEEFARRYPSFEHYIRDPAVHNVMCRFVAGVPDAARALEKLKNGYVFAGTTNRLAESMRLIMLKAGVTPAPLSRVNTSHEVSSRRMGDKARYETILEHLESEDLALYRGIEARMDEAMASLAH